MFLTLACNWDPELPARLAGTAIDELFACRPNEFAGGGRPAMALGRAALSRRFVTRYVRAARARGLSFNYLMNAACFGNREFTRAGQRAIRAELDWLAEIPVDRVTIALPFLASLITRNYPGLKFNVSVYAGVDNLPALRRWEDLGADTVSLNHVHVTRNFPLLRRLAAEARCRLQLLGNNGCVLGCICQNAHPVLTSHASQSWQPSRHLVFDHSMLSCKRWRLANPVELVKADWIRPEDVELYEEIGIRSLKLVDRPFNTDHLLQVARAYTERRYDGNLADLLPPFGGRNPAATQRPTRHHLWSAIRYLLRHPLDLDLRGLQRISPLFNPLEVHIDNRALDGFVRSLAEAGFDCSSRDCEKCGRCAQLAERAVRIDPRYRERMLALFAEAMDDVDSGRLFRAGRGPRRGADG